MIDVKLVICDIDSTLVNEKKELMPITKEALIEVHNKGIYFGIASGRPVDELKQNKILRTIYAMFEKSGTKIKLRVNLKDYL